MHLGFFFLLPLLSIPNIYALPSDDCILLGPMFPAEFDITTTDAFRNAAESFPRAINSLFSNGTLNETGVTFAIDVFSTATNNTIYSYYHSGSALDSYLSTGDLNDNTMFRIGSVTKLFTVYAIIVHSGWQIMEKGVVEILPELKGNKGSDPLDRIVWEDITVGALAAQLGGNGGPPLYAPGCFIWNNCSNEAFLDVMRDLKKPVAPAFATTLYSDSGFQVLGQVLQRVTNLTFNEAIQKVLSKPLGLNSTSSFKPKDGETFNGLVLPGDEVTGYQDWGLDSQISAASGGLYSTTRDLRMIGLAISNSQLLDPRVTRAWMKPRGHTGSLISSVGAPWEINRLALTISASSSRTRISDLYTKLGGQQKYATIFALSPDHKIGYSIMVAGDTAAGIDRFTLRNSVTEVFVQAAEHAAWEHAEKAFTGTFVDPETEGTNLTLTVDTDRPGLGLKEWFEEGVDIRANVSGSPALDADAQSFRLYPMGLVSEGPSSLLESYGSESSERKRMAWRARFQPKKLVAHSAVEGGQGLFDNSRCEQWASVDFLDLYSNGIGTDEFVLGLVDGRLETVEYRSTGMVLKRLE